MRKPVAAAVAHPIPTLAAMLAGAAAAQGCAHVECGETRGDELRAHGAASVDALRQGRVLDGLREIAVATGVRPHQTTHVPEVHRPGEAPAVAPQPLPLPPRLGPLTGRARGRVAIVDPTPVEPPAPPPPPPPRPRRRTPPRPPIATAGAPMQVGPEGE
ncbi:MAG: hypothetical protein U0325_00320 [Polyangiales bacterium]